MKKLKALLSIILSTLAALVILRLGYIASDHISVWILARFIRGAQWRVPDDTLPPLLILGIIAAVLSAVLLMAVPRRYIWYSAGAAAGSLVLTIWGTGTSFLWGSQIGSSGAALLIALLITAIFALVVFAASLCIDRITTAVGPRHPPLYIVPFVAVLVCAALMVAGYSTQARIYKIVYALHMGVVIPAFAGAAVWRLSGLWDVPRSPFLITTAGISVLGGGIALTPSGLDAQNWWAALTATAILYLLGILALRLAFRFGGEVSPEERCFDTKEGQEASTSRRVLAVAISTIAALVVLGTSYQFSRAVWGGGLRYFIPEAWASRYAVNPMTAGTLITMAGALSLISALVVFMARRRFVWCSTVLATLSLLLLIFYPDLPMPLWGVSLSVWMVCVFMVFLAAAALTIERMSTVLIGHHYRIWPIPLRVGIVTASMHLWGVWVHTFFFYQLPASSTGVGTIARLLPVIPGSTGTLTIVSWVVYTFYAVLVVPIVAGVAVRRLSDLRGVRATVPLLVSAGVCGVTYHFTLGRIPASPQEMLTFAISVLFQYAVAIAAFHFTTTYSTNTPVEQSADEIDCS